MIYDTPSFPNESLANNFELFAAVLDATATGVAITDHRQPDEPIIYCNAAFELLSGRSRDSIIGHNCRFMQGHDTNQDARKILREAITKGISTRVELRNYRSDGALFWIDLMISPVKNKDGVVTHYIGMQTDITKRKKAETDLKSEQEKLAQRIEERTKTIKANEEYLAGIVQTIRESLLVLDKDLTVINANPHFYNTFKVDELETVGKKLYDLGDGQWNLATLRELLERVLPHNNPINGFEVKGEFPHIGHRHMLLNAYQVEHEGDYKDRILLALEDVTERRELERRKDNFLGIASHELKTPLTSIKGYVQVVARAIKDGPSPKAEDILKKSAVYVDKLNNLINDLLDVSKIQSGKLQFRKESFDFNQMVKDAVDGIQAAQPSHAIHITGGDTDSQCRGDKDRLEQVVQNLLTNAIKYSPHSAKVGLHIGKVSNFLKVAVTDYGVGIEKKDHKKIFERFYRVGDIQKDFPGLGIGLYVCQQIIDQHGGTLWVESTIGQGSTFNFTVPIDRL